MAVPRKVFGIGAALAVALAVVLLLQWWLGHNGDRLVLYGNVDIRQVDLAFRVNGRIAKVLVDEGDAVTQGQPLAQLDDDLLTPQRDQAAAELEKQRASLIRLERGYRVEEIAQARAAVSGAAALAENAQINLNRVAAMRATNAISQ